MRKTSISLITLLTLLFGWLSAESATVNVPGDQPTIQTGIDATSNGDTVLIADGTYTGPGNFNINYGGRLIVVRSENGPEFTTIDCQGLGRGFLFNSSEDSSAHLEGIAIINGGTDNGGIVKCLSASPTILNCSFRSGLAFGGIGGGALSLDSSATVIRNCYFIENEAWDCIHDGGGAIRIGFDCNIIIDNSEFIGNYAWEGWPGLLIGGGAILCDTNSITTITDCTFDSNWAGVGMGGAIYVRHSEVNLVRCIFRGNRLSRDPAQSLGISSSTGQHRLVTKVDLPLLINGGAINVNRGVLNVDFCLFVSNEPHMNLGFANAGVIATSSSATVIRNSTIVDTKGQVTPPGSQPSAIYSRWLSPIVENCIIAFGDGPPVVCEGGTGIPILSCTNIYGNKDGDWVGCIAGQETVNGNLNLKPFFCDRSLSDYSLRASSPGNPDNNSCGVLMGSEPVDSTCEDCCFGRTGNIDLIGTEPFEVDLSDLGLLGEFLFNQISPPIPCWGETDVDALGGRFPVDLSDFGLLIDFLFLPPGSVILPDCL